MRITESRLRRIIRSVILESIDDMSDEKFKDDLEQSMNRTNTISILTSSPKFFRKYFGDDSDPDGFSVKIKISDLVKMGFNEDEIKHLVGFPETDRRGRKIRLGGIVRQVFRPVHLKVVEDMEISWRVCGAISNSNFSFLAKNFYNCKLYLKTYVI